MGIKNLRELDFSSQRAIIGGASTGGCSCSTCSCTCSGDQKSNRIDSQADGVTENVTDEMRKRRY